MAHEGFYVDFIVSGGRLYRSLPSEMASPDEERVFQCVLDEWPDLVDHGTRLVKVASKFTHPKLPPPDYCVRTFTVFVEGLRVQFSASYPIDGVVQWRDDSQTAPLS